MEFTRRVTTLRSVPSCIRRPFSRILTSVLASVTEAYSTPATADVRERDCIRAWRLLPRLLLHPARRGGESGREILQGRIRKFDAGNCSELLARRGRTVVLVLSGRPKRNKRPCAGPSRHLSNTAS